MATTPLIVTKADFSNYIEISGNMHTAKIDPRILQAQDFDLRELMGDKFYWSFMSNRGSAANVQLENGSVYFYGDTLYTFYGLKPVVVYYAASRIAKGLDMHFTPNGVMQKRNDFSDHMETKDIAWTAHQQINQGQAYWNMCRDYLDRNKERYPLWPSTCCDGGRKAHPSPRVTSIGSCGAYEPRYNRFFESPITTEEMPIPQQSYFITAHVTPVPFRIAYGNIQNPDYIAKLTDTNAIDNDVEVIDTGTEFIVYGEPDVNGYFLNSYTFIIKA